ncbi:MAG: nucleotide sugar dehydrogenase [Actinobacteria bacterium]|nr:nucleotide sugar dehydrogenase [Actinomycetota bacterium]
MNLLTSIQEQRAEVAVVGLGYVGLPLACRAAGAGLSVTGLDVDGTLIDLINSGQSPIEDVSSQELSEQIQSGRLTATTDPEVLNNADVIVICVPTPLKDELPDMSFIEAASKDVSRHLKAGQLVILESTTYPGTTEEFVLSILETSGLKAGEDFHLGFSPERIDPGNERFGLENVPKIIGGIDEKSTEMMEAFYSTFIDKVVKVSSPRAAEMAKLLENTYRHVNIALVNEIAILCHDLGIDVWEVIEAASTKPFGFQAFYPGPGWGGHCIPVDPAYLSWRVRQLGETARFVELAREINKKMPTYVVQRIGEALNNQGRSLKASKVLVLGITYKADVGDLRESSAIQILEKLAKSGADVGYHDPFVESVDLKGGRLSSVELNEETLSDYDIVMVHTNHSSYDWDFIAAHSPLVLDTRNALHGLQGNIVKL